LPLAVVLGALNLSLALCLVLYHTTQPNQPPKQGKQSSNKNAKKRRRKKQNAQAVGEKWYTSKETQLVYVTLSMIQRLLLKSPVTMGAHERSEEQKKLEMEIINTLGWCLVYQPLGLDDLPPNIEVDPALLKQLLPIVTNFEKYEEISELL
jgi:hypothetical protein